MMAARAWFAVGALFALGSVGLGAFGAHGLKRAVSTWGLSPLEQQHRLDNWDVAARYQMYHGLGLICLGVSSTLWPRRLFGVGAGGLCLGTLLFSGGLYAYVLTGVKGWALIVPVGGSLLLLGWLLSLLAVVLPGPVPNIRPPSASANDAKSPPGV